MEYCYAHIQTLVIFKSDHIYVLFFDFAVCHLSIAMACTTRAGRKKQSRTQRKPAVRRSPIDPPPRAPLSLRNLPLELRLKIWELLLVSPTTVTPRYRACGDCGRKPDSQTQRAGKHIGDCIWDPRLYLNLYPDILQTCRLFYEEGIDLLYAKNRFTNLCQDADATVANFFQSIGENNALRIQSYTLSWPYRTTPGPVLLYLGHLPSLQSLTVNRFLKQRANKRNLQYLSKIRAKNILWDMVHERTAEEYSRIITGRVVKRKAKISWTKTVS